MFIYKEWRPNKLSRIDDMVDVKHTIIAGDFESPSTTARTMYGYWQKSCNL